MKILDIEKFFLWNRIFGICGNEPVVTDDDIRHQNYDWKLTPNRIWRDFVKFFLYKKLGETYVFVD